MTQYKIILKRLLKPKVLISVVSQIALILSLFNINVDMSLASAIITSMLSILALLGVVSNPDTSRKGYGDDIVKCSNCNVNSKHILINGEMVCSECGFVLSQPKK